MCEGVATGGEGFEGGSGTVTLGLIKGDELVGGFTLEGGLQWSSRGIIWVIDRS